MGRLAIVKLSSDNRYARNTRSHSRISTTPCHAPSAFHLTTRQKSVQSAPTIPTFSRSSHQSHFLARTHTEKYTARLARKALCRKNYVPFPSLFVELIRGFGRINDATGTWLADILLACRAFVLQFLWVGHSLQHCILRLSTMMTCMKIVSAN